MEGLLLAPEKRGISVRKNHGKLQDGWQLYTVTNVQEFLVVFVGFCFVFFYFYSSVFFLFVLYSLLKLVFPLMKAEYDWTSVSLIRT